MYPPNTNNPVYSKLNSTRANKQRLPTTEYSVLKKAPPLKTPNPSMPLYPKNPII